MAKYKYAAFFASKLFSADVLRAVHAYLYHKMLTNTAFCLFVCVSVFFRLEFITKKRVKNGQKLNKWDKRKKERPHFHLKSYKQACTTIAESACNQQTNTFKYLYLSKIETHILKCIYWNSVCSALKCTKSKKQNLFFLLL